MTMAVGGQALHWGGACNRFSEEDLRLKSMYGLADDWPIDWAELEKFYVQAERRLNVAGDPSPYAEDRRSAPYPQPAMPLSYNLQVLKKWAEQSGLKFSPLPMSRNVNAPFDGRGACGLYDTCGDVCPTGARYSPDYTYQQLIAAKKITLHDRMLVRKLVLADGKDTIAAAHGYHQDRPERDDRVPREAVRARVRAVLEPASAAAVGEFALSKRDRQSFGARRPLHERPQVHFRAGDDRRRDVPRART